MKDLKNEKLLWQSSNKQLLLTSHRLREMKHNIFGSTIKSIMLEELNSCELKTLRQGHLLRQGLILFLLINGSVFLLNHYLFKAELIKLIFNEVHIGKESAQMIFYFSLVVSFVYILLFLLSFKKVFSFNTTGLTINMELRRLSFEERDSFISMIEEAKDERIRFLHEKK